MLRQPRVLKNLSSSSVIHHTPPTGAGLTPAPGDACGPGANLVDPDDPSSCSRVLRPVAVQSRRSAADEITMSLAGVATTISNFMNAGPGFLWGLVCILLVGIPLTVHPRLHCAPRGGETQGAKRDS